MINKVILIGRLETDPEIRSTSGGTEAASFRLATTEAWTNKSGRNWSGPNTILSSPGKASPKFAGNI